MKPQDLLARLEAGYEYDPMYGQLCNERDRLAADNAKLREQIHWLKRGDILHVLTDQEYIDQRERERLMQVSIDALDNENAKLRELAVGMYGMLEMVDKMLGNHDACETPRPLIFGEDKSFKDVMRELGVEVDE